jgi:hypothetical protein
MDEIKRKEELWGKEAQQQSSWWEGIRLQGIICCLALELYSLLQILFLYFFILSVLNAFGQHDIDFDF